MHPIKAIEEIQIEFLPNFQSPKLRAKNRVATGLSGTNGNIKKGSTEN